MINSKWRNKKNMRKSNVIVSHEQNKLRDTFCFYFCFFRLWRDKQSNILDPIFISNGHFKQ